MLEIEPSHFLIISFQNSRAVSRSQARIFHGTKPTVRGDKSACLLIVTCVTRLSVWSWRRRRHLLSTRQRTSTRLQDAIRQQSSFLWNVETAQIFLQVPFFVTPLPIDVSNRKLVRPQRVRTSELPRNQEIFRPFRGIYCLHLHGRRANQDRKQKLASS
jgi:hypothetical protein